MAGIGIDKLKKVYDFVTIKSEPPFSVFEFEIYVATDLSPKEIAQCMRLLGQDGLKLIDYDLKHTGNLDVYFIKNYRYSILNVF